jgi:transcriptional regulator with XRE-family HTH domain
VEQIAEHAGVSRVTLYAWRYGKSTPSTANLLMLADALEVRAAALTKLVDEIRRATR